MSKSLSVILPVCNAAEKLADCVLELLEMAMELTQDVELLIVDDGSTDHTEEIAMDLCRHYPQIRMCRRSRNMGLISAANVGMKQTSGDIVLVHDIDSPLSCEAVRRFWDKRDNNESVESGHHRGMRARSRSQLVRRQAVDARQEPLRDQNVGSRSDPRHLWFGRTLAGGKTRNL